MKRNAIGVIGIALVVVGLLGMGTVAAFEAGSRADRASLRRPPFGGMMRRTPRSRWTTPTSPGWSLEDTRGTGTAPASPGERIFFRGEGSSGPIPREGGFGMMGFGGCAGCHGADGRGRRFGGGMMGRAVDAPDIRYSALTTARGGEPGWTDAQIATAIREGKEPDGKRMSAFMPRWRMDDAEMGALLAYLKQLE